MSWTCRCGQTLTNTCQHCGECHETFVGTSAGDAHRVGPHEGDRRCLTPHEMLAHPKREFRQDGRGYWHLGPEMTRDAAQRVYRRDSRAEQGSGGIPGPPDAQIPVSGGFS